MSLFDELPQEFKPAIVLGDIDGYLHVYSGLDDETLVALLEMAIDTITNQDYDLKTTTLQ